MPKVKISEYSATANSNTDVASINIDEGCAPSGINNAIRAVMGHLKDFQQGTNGDPFNGPVNGTLGATTPSTGAFTTLSASGIITSTATAGQVVKAESGTTGILYSNFVNTGGTFLYGIDNSAGTALFSGSAAYAGFIGTSGARPLVLATNGAGRAFIDSSGNVGIGTSSPSQKLDVFSGTASSAVAQFTGVNTGRGLKISTALANSVNDAGVILDAQQASGVLMLATGGTERARIDASGNLGLGVTPSDWSASYKAISIGFAGGGQFAGGTANTQTLMSSNLVFTGTGATGWKLPNNVAGTNYEQYLGVHKWYNAAANGVNGDGVLVQAMTLDASGNLLVGTTGKVYEGKISVSFDGNGGAGSQGISLIDTNASLSGDYALFVNSSGNVAGRITHNGTTTVAYTTSSDYRLKENIAPMTGALAKVAALKPVTYKWKDDQSASEGFIAHELAEVCPQAVVGEKDAIDEDGNPKYQGIDTSFLVATLTAAIQEQQALITQLQADVAALKGA